MRHLYQKGLLDPDSQTQGYDGMQEDYQNGGAFLNVFNFLGSTFYNSDSHAQEGKAMYPCPPEDAAPICYGQNIYGGNRIWSIGAKTEYPELCMAILNWLSTPEGRMTAEYGPKDVCWYYDENGKTQFTDLGRAAKTDISTQMSDGYSGTFDDGSFKMNNTTWAIDSLNPDSMDDEEAKVIFCSRGGYGAVHLIGKLDFTKFRQHPKWLIGFSDITALHNLFQQNGFASLHAPMARHLTVEPEDDFCTQALKDILFGQALGGTEAFSYVCPGHKLNHKGEGKGVLRGGNLSVFYGLRGTPYDIPAEGTILFIEDVGERPHAVERMMYNLKLGGVLDKLSGLIIGQFTEYEENKSLGKDLYGALADLVKEYDYPICFDFPVGHVSMNVPLINGAAVTLKVGKKEVKLSFNTERE